jgi:hypothetical protein
VSGCEELGVNDGLLWLLDVEPRLDVAEPALLVSLEAVAEPFVVLVEVVAFDPRASVAQSAPLRTTVAAAAAAARPRRVRRAG